MKIIVNIKALIRKIVKFSPNELISSFFDIDKNTNLKVIYCYKLVFSLKGQKGNIGSIIFIILNIFFLIVAILHFILGRRKI